MIVYIIFISFIANLLLVVFNSVKITFN